MTTLQQRFVRVERDWSRVRPRCQQIVHLRWLRPTYWHHWTHVRTRTHQPGYYVCDRCGVERH
jgi:hypothetical protein